VGREGREVSEANGRVHQVQVEHGLVEVRDARLAARAGLAPREVEALALDDEGRHGARVASHGEGALQGPARRQRRGAGERAPDVVEAQVHRAQVDVDLRRVRIEPRGLALRLQLGLPHEHDRSLDVGGRRRLRHSHVELQGRTGLLVEDNRPVLSRAGERHAGEVREDLERRLVSRRGHAHIHRSRASGRRARELHVEARELRADASLLLGPHGFRLSGQGDAPVHPVSAGERLAEGREELTQRREGNVAALEVRRQRLALLRGQRDLAGHLRGVHHQLHRVEGELPTLLLAVEGEVQRATLLLVHAIAPLHLGVVRVHRELHRVGVARQLRGEWAVELELLGQLQQAGGQPVEERAQVLHLRRHVRVAQRRESGPRGVQLRLQREAGAGDVELLHEPLVLGLVDGDVEVHLEVQGLAALLPRAQHQRARLRRSLRGPRAEALADLGHEVDGELPGGRTHRVGGEQSAPGRHGDLVELHRRAQGRHGIEGEVGGQLLEAKGARQLALGLPIHELRVEGDLHRLPERDVTHLQRHALEGEGPPQARVVDGDPPTLDGGETHVRTLEEREVRWLVLGGGPLRLMVEDVLEVPHAVLVPGGAQLQVVHAQRGELEVLAEGEQRLEQREAHVHRAGRELRLAPLAGPGQLHVVDRRAEALFAGELRHLVFLLPDELIGLEGEQAYAGCAGEGDDGSKDDGDRALHGSLHVMGTRGASSSLRAPRASRARAGYSPLRLPPPFAPAFPFAESSSGVTRPCAAFNSGCRRLSWPRASRSVKTQSARLAMRRARPGYLKRSSSWP
jgi:hypothetical protein